MKRLLPVALLLLAAPAFAGIVNAEWSTAPTHLNLVGRSGGVADPAGATFVIARDSARNPTQGVSVWVDFSRAPDLTFCTDGPGAVDCTARTLRLGYTGPDGRLDFTLTGSARRGMGRTGPGTVWLFEDGVYFGSGTNPPLVVGAFDLDGTGGVGGNDLSLWLEDFAASVYAQRADYNGDGSVGGDDLSLMLEELGSGRSTESCTSVCP